jgi:hypothetical protein
VKGHEVQIIDNGVYQLAMIPVRGWDAMKTIDTKGVHPISKESAVINVWDNFTPGSKQPVIYATLMLWKKSGEKWSNDELAPVKSIKPISDNEVIVSLNNGNQKIVKFN